MRQLLKASISFGLIGCLVLSPISFVPAIDLTVQAKSSSATVTAERVTTDLYATWSAKGKRVTTVRSWNRVIKTGEYGKWSRIRVGGKTGWLPSSYLKEGYSNKPISRTVYGSHTYGVDTQAEYDAVYKRVKAEFDAKYDSPEFGFDSYMHRVLNGERGNRDPNSPEYMGLNNGRLLNAEDALAPYFEGRMSLKTYEKMYRTNNFLEYVYNKYESTGVVGEKNLKSAYDVLFRGKSDCDSKEQVKSLVYDLAGIDNVVVGDGVTHAVLMFKVDEGWMGSGYKAYTKSEIDSINSSSVYLSYIQKGTRISY